MIKDHDLKKNKKQTHTQAQKEKMAVAHVKSLHPLWYKVKQQQKDPEYERCFSCYQQVWRRRIRSWFTAPASIPVC